MIYARQAALVPRAALVFAVAGVAAGGGRDAAAEAPRVTAPTTIVAAEFDAVVPSAHARALHAAFRPGVAELLVESDLDHNTPLLESADFRRALQER